MLVTNDAPQRARWAVMWIASKNGKSKLMRKDFGDDMKGALDLYVKVKQAGRRAPTLACVNMGFPPPESLRPRTVKKRGRNKRTGKMKIVTVDVQPLRDLNHKGKLWCPYCRELRPFVFKTKFKIHGVPVSDPRYVCPICGVSQRDHNVRVWNPTAAIHMDSSIMARTRRSSRTTVRRRRRASSRS